MGGGTGNFILQLVSSDLQATEAFYRGILELPMRRALTSRGAPEYLTLPLDGGGEVMFVDEERVMRAHPDLAGRLAEFPKGVGVTLHFRVKEIEDISDAIEEEDMEILHPLEAKPYGVKELWCFDPDGYLVVLEEPWR